MALFQIFFSLQGRVDIEWTHASSAPKTPKNASISFVFT